MSTYAYLRVSTADQNIETQRYAILEYANSKNIGHIDFVEEKISSRVDWKKRAIGELIIKNTNKGDTVLFTEATRAARSTLELLEIMKVCSEKELQIIIIKENINLNVAGKSEIEKVMMQNTIAMLGMAGDLTRAFTRQRTIEGIARAKAQGRNPGRPKGGRNKRLKLDPHYKMILRALAAGQTRSAILRLLNDQEDFQTHRNTLSDWLNHWKIKETLGHNPTNERREKYRTFINNKRREIAAYLEEQENATNSK